MKKTLLIPLLFISSYFSIEAQTNSSLWGGLEIGYGLSLSDKGDIYKYSHSRENNMSITTARGVLGYYITQQMSVGFNIGLNSYSKPTLSTIPMMLDLRYHPLADNLNLFFHGGLGYSMLTSEDELKGKLLADFSAGYKILQINKINIVPSIGYNYFNYSMKHTNLGQNRHSILLRIGVFY